MNRIIAVGKKHEDWVSSGIFRYEKRLKPPFNVEWVLIPHSSQEALQARQNESGAVLSRLRQDEYVVLLDETGTSLPSPKFSDVLSSTYVNGKRVVFIIGGAYGVSDKLKARADYTLSLSALVFPHQLVRLILIEQLYRAQEIANGSPYHHV